MLNYSTKLNELPYDAELLNALGELEMRIIESYAKFNNRGDRYLTKAWGESYDKFVKGLGYFPGNKYLKITCENFVWGFINLTNKNFKEGDILKAMSWKAPALNKARGNIFNEDYSVAWTGPHYISGYCAGGKRNGKLIGE